MEELHAMAQYNATRRLASGKPLVGTRSPVSSAYSDTMELGFAASVGCHGVPAIEKPVIGRHLRIYTTTPVLLVSILL